MYKFTENVFKELENFPDKGKKSEFVKTILSNLEIFLKKETSNKVYDGKLAIGYILKFPYQKYWIVCNGEKISKNILLVNCETQEIKESTYV